MRRSRFILGLLLTCVCIVAVPSPASAATEATARCEAVFPVWPGWPGNPATCGAGRLPLDGWVFGIAPFSAPGVCLTGCSFEADFDSYSDTCVTSFPPPVGSGNGTILVNGSAVAGFQMLRVGLATIFVPLGEGTFIGVGTFVPEPPIGTCAAPMPLYADMTWQE